MTTQPAPDREAALEATSGLFDLLSRAITRHESTDPFKDADERNAMSTAGNVLFATLRAYLSCDEDNTP